MVISDQQRLTQHERFAIIHPNPSLTLRTSPVLETISSVGSIPVIWNCNFGFVM